MLHSTATIETPNASRYLVQLCKHWSHKFAVEYTPAHGEVPFGPDRTCIFDARPDALIVELRTADEATQTRMQGVVIDHLKRFAFREDLGEVMWHSPAPGPLST